MSSNTANEAMQKELSAARWAVDKISLISLAGVLLALVLMCNLSAIVGGIVFVASVAFYGVSMPALRKHLEYRRQWVAFATATGTICAWSHYPGDTTVEARRVYIVEWLERTENKNAKCISGIYEGTRFFSHWVASDGKIDSRSHERDASTFRESWEAFEAECEKFKNQIDRAIVEESYTRSTEWTHVHILNQVA